MKFCKFLKIILTSPYLALTGELGVYFVSILSPVSYLSAHICHFLTRTTRPPAFWDTPRRPMITHTRDSHQIQVKTRQSQSYKFKKIAKNSNFQILWATLHATHFLKLLDKMCKYETDPARTVGVTERTQDAGRTDGQTDGRTEWNQYTPPQQLSCVGGMIMQFPKNTFYLLTTIHIST